MSRLEEEYDQMRRSCDNWEGSVPADLTYVYISIGIILVPIILGLIISVFFLLKGRKKKSKKVMKYCCLISIIILAGILIIGLFINF